MIVIAFGSRCPRITITNDETHTEVYIECRNYDEEREMAISIVKELTKNE